VAIEKTIFGGLWVRTSGRSCLTRRGWGSVDLVLVGSIQAPPVDQEGCDVRN
jgi:hypothetical protein